MAATKKIPAGKSKSNKKARIATKNDPNYIPEASKIATEPPTRLQR
jgi:hypothetical protein